MKYLQSVYNNITLSIIEFFKHFFHHHFFLCSGAFRTSPVKSLYVDCYDPALELKRQLLSLHYYFRIQSNTNHSFHDFKLRPFLLRLQDARKSFIPVFKRVHDILPDFNLLYLHVTPQPKTNFPPWGTPVVQFLNPFQTFIKSDTADIIYQQIFIEHRQEYDDFIAIYTDGSKSADHVSFAVVFPNTTFSFKLHSSCSVFTAEIAAVLLALEKIYDCLERKFIIYTDSLSVLESLKSFYMHSHHHPLVLNVLHLLNKLASRDFNILLCWVPSHVGIAGNEKADKAAKLATAPTNSSTPLTDFKKYTKLLFYTKWQRQWDTETDNKLHSVKPHVQPWPSLTTRKADTLLTRLRVGHTRYTHRHLLFGEQTPMCSQCNWSIASVLRQEGFVLSDQGSEDTEIGLLIGNDLINKILTGKTCRLLENLMLYETIFGWVISGSSRGESASNCTFSMCTRVECCEEERLSDLLYNWFQLESLGINDSLSGRSETDEKIIQKFEENLRFENGRYVTGLLWKREPVDLRDNFHLAKRQFDRFRGELKTNSFVRNQCEKIIKFQKANNIVEECNENETGYFMSYRSLVRKDKSTTQVRLVFNCSSSKRGDLSLNDYLEQGPNLNPSLLEVLLKFRIFKVDFCGDIEKAFLMIGITEDDRRYLRFLWNTNDKGK
ncbi:hypothetical protein AVEN_94136-1 [Araneus ventricosus]|uniref:RNase H type-1 domain-containing protein n=1 Tax=Araneus ventricosus TaxID=182803 RepID=A0A4Y2TXL3_ARAVE|nr:hypothetical protein AVEN_98936-1 [Araneus ventricosus]GBO05364.1 hypothetical protein AVEN_94136-1 [Araneus ventricosus]